MSTASAADVRRALDSSGGILRLAPTWLPRAFLMPGKRIKLSPSNSYASVATLGGIDERWFSSAPPAANENRTPDEGLSYVVVNGKKAFTLLDAVGIEGMSFIGKPMFDNYQRWPV